MTLTLAQAIAQLWRALALLHFLFHFFRAHLHALLEIEPLNDNINARYNDDGHEQQEQPGFYESHTVEQCLLEILVRQNTQATEQAHNVSQAHSKNDDDFEQVFENLGEGLR